MKLINQSAQYLPQGVGIDGIYKQIELAGRTSYLSWDKMTDDSAKKFVDMLIKSKHTSVLEHGTVYLKIPFKHVVIKDKELDILNSKYRNNTYSKLKCITKRKTDNSENIGNYITTNLRVLQENNWMEDLQFLCEPTEFHEKRLSVKVITDIGVTREFNRHRTFSIVEQSTRYCNFSKDKFGNELTFIIPEYWKEYYRVALNQNDEYSCKNSGNGILILNQNQETVDWNFVRNKMLCETLINLLDIENHYIFMTSYTYNGKTPYKPEQARQILPLCTKTEVVYTAFESDWRHFFDLRLFGKTGEPHPQMKQLAELIKQEFEKAGVWEGIMKYPSKYD